MRLAICIVCAVGSLLLAAIFLWTTTPASIPKSDNDGENDSDINMDLLSGDGKDRGMIPNALEEARKLEPPVATSTESGDTEGSEWWLEHDTLLRSAWNEWDDENNNSNDNNNSNIVQRLPILDASSMIDPNLHHDMDRTRKAPTTEHEAFVHGALDEVMYSSSSASNHHRKHRVYRCPGFLTLDGIQKIRKHLDALSESGIPNRRPNAMNRNGLLLDPTIPGGISGDPELHRFVELLANDYLRPLGRSKFPEFAGDPQDDAKHYAFTIRYGSSSDAEATVANAPGTTTATTTSSTTTTTTATATTDWDLKEHTDASIYTLNINLNLPEENYSGSSLYFVSPEDTSSTDINTSNNNATANANATKIGEVFFEPGDALLHRGMTRHGARPLVGGKRNNLVIWLHGTEGYVRIAPYHQDDRMSVQERWSAKATTVLETDDEDPKKKNSFPWFGRKAEDGTEL